MSHRDPTLHVRFHVNLTSPISTPSVVLIVMDICVTQDRAGRWFKGVTLQAPAADEVGVRGAGIRSEATGAV